MRWSRTALLAALCAVMIPAAKAIQASEFVPHRGNYTMTLLSADQASGIIGATGEMYFEWGEACDGWVVKEHIRLYLTDTQSRLVSIGLVFSGWEARDGSRLQFNLRHLSDSEVTDEIQGEAVVDREDGGVARFSSPPGLELELPRGTRFPAAFSQEMVQRLASGDDTYGAVLFDGSTTEGAYEVSGFLGEPILHVPPGLRANSEERERVWPVRLAYFPLGMGDAEPEFEIGMLVNAGNVAHRFDLDYGSFTVRASLTEYEVLPEPDCP